MGLEPTPTDYEKYGRAPYALAAQMTQIIALTALTTLELSCEPFHEPFHARDAHVPSSCYCA